jgi:type II secretory pathway component PulM
MNWIMNRPAREQWTLVGGAVGVVLLAFWILVLDPLLASSNTARSRVHDARVTLVNVQDLSARLQRARESAASRTQQSRSISTLLNEAAALSAIDISAMDTTDNGNSASIRVDQAEVSALLAWLHGIDQHEDLVLETMTLTTTADSDLLAATLRVSVF